MHECNKFILVTCNIETKCIIFCIIFSGAVRLFEKLIKNRRHLWVGCQYFT